MGNTRITRKPETHAQLQIIIERYEQSLLRYAASILNDADLACDAVQETFLRLWKTGRSAESRQGLPSWLFTVCRNVSVDMVRKDSRMTRLQNEDQTLEEQSVPVDREQNNDVSDHLSSVISSLPAEQQEVLRLKFQNSFTYRQIAEITGQTVANVGFKLHTGLKTIRERLALAGISR